MGAPAEIIEGGIVGMGNVFGIAQDHLATLHRRVQFMVFVLDGVFGLGLLIDGGVRCLEIGLELFPQILGVDGRIREEVPMGLEARDDVMDQGHDLAFGFGESHNSYLLGFLNNLDFYVDALMKRLRMSS